VEQILNGRDLSKKGSAAPPACAVRTASKAIALFAQSKERLLYGEPD